jgi:hypothetical protein
MRRTLGIVLIVSAALQGAGAVLAADEVAPRELSAPRRGFSIEAAPLGLRLTTPAFGLRLEYDPLPPAYEERGFAPRYESPFRGGPDQALRFWSSDLGQSEGWRAFGAYGSMRFSKDFFGGSDTTLRFGGRQNVAPGLPDRLDLGIRYRFRF